MGSNAKLNLKLPFSSSSSAYNCKQFNNVCEVSKPHRVIYRLDEDNDDVQPPIEEELHEDELMLYPTLL